MAEKVPAMRYKVYMYNGGLTSGYRVLLFDSGSGKKPIIKDPTHDIEEMAAGSMEFTLFANAKAKMYSLSSRTYYEEDGILKYISPRQTEIVLVREILKGSSTTYTSKILWSGRVTALRKNFYKDTVIYVEGAMSYLSDFTVTDKTTTYKNDPPNVIFKKLITDYNSKVSNNTIPGGKVIIGTTDERLTFNELDRHIYYGGASINSQNSTVASIGNTDIKSEFEVSSGESFWSALESLSNQFGGYFEMLYDNNGRKSIYYHKENEYHKYIEGDSQPIEFGVNLLDYLEELDLGETVTAIRPVGASYTEEQDGKSITVTTNITTVSAKDHTLGDPYIRNEAAIKKYGFNEKVVTWGSINNPNNLYLVAKNYLETLITDKPVITINAFDLKTLAQNTIVSTEPWITDHPDLIKSRLLRFDALYLFDKVKLKSEYHGVGEEPISKITIPLDKFQTETKYTIATRKQLKKYLAPGAGLKDTDNRQKQQQNEYDKDQGKTPEDESSEEYAPMDAEFGISGNFLHSPPIYLARAMSYTRMGYLKYNEFNFDGSYKYDFSFEEADGSNYAGPETTIPGRPAIFYCDNFANRGTASMRPILPTDANTNLYGTAGCFIASQDGTTYNQKRLAGKKTDKAQVFEYGGNTDCSQPWASVSGSPKAHINMREFLDNHETFVENFQTSLASDDKCYTIHDDNANFFRTSLDVDGRLSAAGYSIEVTPGKNGGVWISRADSSERSSTNKIRIKILSSVDRTSDRFDAESGAYNVFSILRCGDANDTVVVSYASAGMGFREFGETLASAWAYIDDWGRSNNVSWNDLTNPSFINSDLADQGWTSDTIELEKEFWRLRKRFMAVPVLIITEATDVTTGSKNTAIIAGTTSDGNITVDPDGTINKTDFTANNSAYYGYGVGKYPILFAPDASSDNSFSVLIGNTKACVPDCSRSIGNNDSAWQTTSGIGTPMIDILAAGGAHTKYVANSVYGVIGGSPGSVVIRDRLDPSSNDRTHSKFWAERCANDYADFVMDHDSGAKPLAHASGSSVDENRKEWYDDVPDLMRSAKASIKTVEDVDKINMSLVWRAPVVIGGKLLLSINDFVYVAISTNG